MFGFFKGGFITATFSELGTHLVDRETFIMFNIGWPSTGSSSFSSLVGIGSSMQLEGLEAMIIITPAMLFQQCWMSSHICWAYVGCFYFHSEVQLIPYHLNWVEVGWLWRPGHLMQHSITPLLNQIALTQPGGVVDHYPVEKQMIVPLSAKQIGWWIATKWCGSHAG